MRYVLDSSVALKWFLSEPDSVRAHLDPWAYLTHVLSKLATPAPGPDLNNLLPDEWPMPPCSAGHRTAG